MDPPPKKKNAGIFLTHCQVNRDKLSHGFKLTYYVNAGLI